MFRLRPHTCSKRVRLGISSRPHVGDLVVNLFFTFLLGVHRPWFGQTQIGQKQLTPSDHFGSSTATLEKVHHEVSWPTRKPPNVPVWNINVVTLYVNVENGSKFHEQMTISRNFLAMNGKLWVQKKFSSQRRYGKSFEKNGHCNANPFLKWIVKTQWLLEDNRYILSWLGIHSAKKWHFGSLWWSWDEKLFSDVWTGQNRVQFVEIPTHQVYQLPINISDQLCGAGKVFTRHRLDNPVKCQSPWA